MSVVFDNLDIFLEGMRRTVELSVLSFIVALVLGVVIVATLVPAWRAARTNPLTALRHQ